MSVFSAISHFTRDFRDARARYLTERELGSLPYEIRKDIGWPVDDATHTGPKSR